VVVCLPVKCCDWYWVSSLRSGWFLCRPEIQDGCQCKTYFNI